MNNLKVFSLLAGMTALFGVVGQALGGQGGMLIALLVAGVMNFIMYFTSSKTVLHAYKARILSPEEASGLYATVDKLRQRAGLPVPTVAIAPHAQPNAFATGRNPQHAVVCVTEGLLQLVDQDELEGVLAHELGHVKNHDMLLQTLSATMAGAISNLARFGLYSPTAQNERASPLGPLLALLAPIAAMIIQFAVSRQREFKADATGAQISGRVLNQVRNHLAARGHAERKSYPGPRLQAPVSQFPGPDLAPERGIEHYRLRRGQLVDPERKVSDGTTPGVSLVLALPVSS